VSARGETTSRLRNGRVKHVFPSSLPAGNRRGADSQDSGFSILDCIFHAPTKTYFVLDLICWNGTAIADSDTEFRLFWAASKLQEVPVAVVSKYNRFSFTAVPVWKADPSGIRNAYEAELPYRKDGLLFLNQHATYTPGEEVHSASLSLISIA